MVESLNTNWTTFSNGYGFTQLGNANTLYHGTYFKYSDSVGSITFCDVANNAEMYVFQKNSSGYKLHTIATTDDIPSDSGSGYIHPSYVSRSEGLYKVTVDSTGHVATASAVTKSDITSLGIQESLSPVNGTCTAWNGYIISQSCKRFGKLCSIKITLCANSSQDDTPISNNVSLFNLPWSMDNISEMDFSCGCNAYSSSDGYKSVQWHYSSTYNLITLVTSCSPTRLFFDFVYFTS